VSLTALAAGIYLVVTSLGDQDRLLIPAYAHLLGQPDAPVTVVEWADFQCPVCRFFSLGSEQELKADAIANGQVRLIYRHFAFLGPESLKAAEASECAGDQDQFFEYHDKLFENWNGENQGAYADPNLKRFAAELALDRQQFDSCLDSRKYQRRVQDDNDIARRLGVNATPTFFINGEIVRGAPRDYAVLRQLIDTALAKK
jgi:protein-disulfide isomerase